MNDIKKEMKERARLARGLTNALGYDIDNVFMDVTEYDIFCMTESIRETQDTLHKLTENINELEHLLNIIKRDWSREKHLL